MINQMKTALFSALRNTTPYLTLSSCSSKVVFTFKRYVPIDLACKKIDFYKTTKKVVEEHKKVIKNTDTNISAAVIKDINSIQKLSILLANDIIILCFPSQSLNPLYEKFYDKKQVGFAEFLLENRNIAEGETCLEYKERTLVLNSLSNSIEELLYNNLNSHEHPLFKGPLITRLSSYEGIPLNFLAQIKTEKDSIPPVLCLLAKYEKGTLTASLKAKSPLVNATKFSIPVPHIAEIADLATEHFQEYETQKEFHNCFFAKILKGLKL